MMSVNQPFPTVKRSACDRCRLQKLRCPPREPNTDACTRCTRLGAKCTTSYPRSAGRAGGTSRSATTSGPAQQSLPQNWLPALPHAGGSATESSTSVTTWFPGTHGRSSSSLRILESTRVSHSQSTSSLNALDSFSFTLPTDDWPIVPDALMLFDRGPSDGLMDHELDDFPNAFNAVPGLEGSDGKKDSRQRIDSFIQEPASSSSQVLGGDQRLSKLNLDLSKWLEGRSENSSITELSSDLSPEPGGDSGVQGSGQSKLLSDALSHSSELLAIIQSYGPERRGSMDGSGNNSTSGTKIPRLGIIVTLNVVSVYLQLVAMYEKLFQDLSNQFFDSAADLISDLKPLPTLQLTGFGVQNGHLQTKILIHAILHQFESIERILGLPVEFRVTEKQDEYSGGLFEERNAQDLLQAIISGDGAKTGEKRYDALPLDDYGFKALPSLREALQRVQISLDM